MLDGLTLARPVHRQSVGLSGDHVLGALSGQAGLAAAIIYFVTYMIVLAAVEADDARECGLPRRLRALTAQRCSDEVQQPLRAERLFE